jgi:Arc/MetJ-type ribon-helix-helix transcriptional regulator
VLATKRYKGADAVVRDKLAKWEGKTALQWDWLTHNVELNGAPLAARPSDRRERF